VGDAVQESSLFLQIICDAFGPASGACSPTNKYPTQTAVALLPIPHERGMEDPCEGVPSNSWCQDDDD
jgi:hypothetical protein